MSSGDRAEEFRTDLLGRLSQIYLCSRRNKDRTDFTFDIDKVNQPTEQGGLRLEKFELPFIEKMLKEISRDGLIELIPDQRRYRLTARGMGYLIRLFRRPPDKALSISLLYESKIRYFNEWRKENPTLIPDISFQNFSGKDLPRAYLNGVFGTQANLSDCNLSNANLVQAEFTEVNLEGANLSNSSCMFSNMKRCNLSNADLTGTNFMYANLQDSDLTDSKISHTNFVQSNLRNVKTSNTDKSTAYLRFAKLEGSGWK